MNAKRNGILSKETGKYMGESKHMNSSKNKG